MLEVFNVLDSDDYDIDYFYVFRLFGELEEGIEDLYYYFVELRNVCFIFLIKY